MFQQVSNQSLKKIFGKTGGIILFAITLIIGMTTFPYVGKYFSQSRQPVKERRFELKGVVKSVDCQHRQAVIKHEKVGSYMEAMTMPFVIRDEKALKEMQPQDQLVATLVISSDKGEWLEKITIYSRAK